jgi:serine/threonine protein kinase/outer membrane protein assembly factor BamD (BamD/ComL family)
MSNLIGQTLSNYRVIEQLGAGGMGVVYKAQDVTLGRYVALKLLPARTADDKEAVERFRREARTASALNHPNICTIYSFAEHEGQFLLAMELLDGQPLDQKIHDQPLDVRVLLEIATQVADALEAAHAEGIVHRDIKPGNIFVTRRGQVKVLDFGLAKLAPGFDDSSPTHRFTSRTGLTVGTVSYMSPEQARGETLDSRTDLFSFGVVLYEMATGRQGFEGSTTALVFDGILNREPRPPRTVNANVPAELERIITKALEKDRTLRYQTAADLRADLQRLKRDSASRAGTLGDSVRDPSTTVVVPSASHPASLPPPASAAGGTTPAAERRLSTGAIVALVIGGLALVSILGGLAITVIGMRWALNNEDVKNAVSDATRIESPPAAAPAPSAAPAPPVSQAETPESVTPDKPPTPVRSTPPAQQSGSVRATAKTPPVEVAPPRVDRESAAENTAAERLDIAQAKVANNLFEPALIDLRQIALDFPNTPSAAEASFLAASLLEKLGRNNDAMAAYVEFNQRYGSDRRVPQSKLRLADLTNRSRRPNRELAARDMWNEIVRDHPGTTQAMQALQLKIRFESDRRQLRELDPTIGVEVPAVVNSLRTLIEQFPNSAAAMDALQRLAQMYVDVNQYERAAQALTALATRFPNAADVWFRVGELYERRLKDRVRAREAYAKVPPGAPHYRQAQERLRR